MRGQVHVQPSNRVRRVHWWDQPIAPNDLEQPHRDLADSAAATPSGAVVAAGTHVEMEAQEESLERVAIFCGGVRLFERLDILERVPLLAQGLMVGQTQYSQDPVILHAALAFLNGEADVGGGDFGELLRYLPITYRLSDVLEYMENEFWLSFPDAPCLDDHALMQIAAFFRKWSCGARAPFTFGDLRIPRKPLNKTEVNSVLGDVRNAAAYFLYGMIRCGQAAQIPNSCDRAFGVLGHIISKPIFGDRLRVHAYAAGRQYPHFKRGQTRQLRILWERSGGPAIEAADPGDDVEAFSGGDWYDSYKGRRKGHRWEDGDLDACAWYTMYY